MTVARGAHVSIGDVLNQLRDEFSDITISKIRFLESQGLVEPERTPSGYRKFYAADVERLRFILREQKQNFLPLKVIKDRLDEIDRSGGFAVPDADAPSPTATAADARAKRRSKKSTREPALFEETRRARARAQASGVVATVEDNDGPDDLAASSSDATLTRRELARAASITDDDVALLEEFGLVKPVHMARDRVLFDQDAVAVARIAGSFMRHGIEPRHLRMYRAFAEREASLFEQVLSPYRRQRNPEANARTAEALVEMATLGRQLRTALLRQSVRRTLEW
ncbi:MAG: MerR family transcriptional regulator [Actinomycetota bacterium]